MKALFSLISLATAATTLFFGSCSSPINSIHDPHFDAQGHYLDSLGATFKSQTPTSLAFFVEASGSMNGFFRANKPTSFKTDVWSIVSNFGSPGVFVLIN